MYANATFPVALIRGLILVGGIETHSSRWSLWAIFYRQLRWLSCIKNPWCVDQLLAMWATARSLIEGEKGSFWTFHTASSASRWWIAGNKKIMKTILFFVDFAYHLDFFMLCTLNSIVSAFSHNAKRSYAPHFDDSASWTALPGFADLGLFIFTLVHWKTAGISQASRKLCEKSNMFKLRTPKSAKPGTFVLFADTPKCGA